MKFTLLSDDNRKLSFNMERINVYASRWKPHTPFEIEITKRQPRKSDPLRSYYFAVVLPAFMEHLGYEKDEELLFHRQLKIVYFNIKPDTKGIYRNVPSVFSNDSDIPVPEKKKFIDWVVRKAAQEGVYIPDPNEE
jgi:hypothetical protein